jgi:DNA-binding SARP family transcriptional activator
MTTASGRRGGAAGHAAAGDLRLNLLGEFSMVVDGESWQVPDGCKRLLGFLALQDRPQRRPVIAATLWPDKPDDRASANLRSSLWRMPQPSGRRLVRATGATLQLAGHLHVDVRAIEATGWALIRNPNAVADDVDPTPFLLELLPGWYEDWVVFERERLAQLQLHFLEALTHVLVQRRRIAEALDIAVRLVHVDPLREGSQRALLAVHCAERNIGQAHHQYERYRDLIRETFGCDPSPSLRAMITSALQTDLSDRPEPLLDEPEQLGGRPSRRVLGRGARQNIDRVGDRRPKAVVLPPHPDNQHRSRTVT